MQVSRWADSLEVRLPRALVTDHGFEPGDELERKSVERRAAIPRSPGMA